MPAERRDGWCKSQRQRLRTRPGAAVSNALTHSGVIGKDGFRRFESGQYLSELGWYRRLYSLSQAF